MAKVRIVKEIESCKSRNKAAAKVRDLDVNVKATGR